MIAELTAGDRPLIEFHVTGRLQVYRKGIVWHRQDSAYAHGPDELAGLVDLWWNTLEDVDATLAGVIADWLGDHADQLVSAYAETAPLAPLVETARRRFMRDYHDPRRALVVTSFT